MSEETIRYVIEHWDSVSVGLVLFLLVVGAGWLFFTDRLISPKSIAALQKSKTDLEARCAGLDALVDAATAELTDAKVNYAKAATKLEFLEAERVRLQAEAAECRQHLDRARMEAEVRNRWTQGRQPEERT